MSWLSDFTRRWRARPTCARERDPDHVLDETHLAMASALTFALDARNRDAGFIEHCARVATYVQLLGERFGLSPAELEYARAAAELHEIGMIAVPAELLQSARKLTPDELLRVRQHAAVGAEIVRATQSPFVARLIEHQYTDFSELRRRLAPHRAEVLLAGILRVADVFDAMTHPRPYQGAVPEWYRAHVMRSGAGTKFHPAAVAVLLQTSAG